MKVSRSREKGYKGLRCGNSYISRAKKCYLGQVSDRDRAIKRLTTRTSSGSVLNLVQRRMERGLLGEIKVNRDDFDWPGNGQSSASIEARYKTFRKGDLIENAFEVKKGVYARHYGVYAGIDRRTGERMVYQVSAREGGGRVVAKQPLTMKKNIEFSAWRKTDTSEMYQEPGSRPLSREEIISRAESTVGRKFNYNLFRNNCENYARAIVEGKSYSTQGQRVSPLTRLAGDVLSVKAKGGVGKKGISAKDIVRDLDQINLKQGDDLTTRKSYFLAGRRDSLDLEFLGDLKAPDDFYEEVEGMVSSLPGSGRDIIRREFYTNYLMILTRNREID